MVDICSEEIPLHEEDDNLLNNGPVTKIVPTTACQRFIADETTKKKQKSANCGTINAETLYPISTASTAGSLNGNNNHQSLRSAYSFVKIERELNDMSATSQYDLDYSKEMDTEM